MPHSVAIAILILSVSVSGCTTTIRNEFHGQLHNLKRDGQTTTLRAEITGYRTGPSRIGGRFVGFLLPENEFSFFLFHPALTPGETLVTNIPSHQVDAWLIRGDDSDLPDFVASSDPEQLRHHGGERLT